MKTRLLILSLMAASVFCSCEKNNEPPSPIAKSNTLSVTIENAGTLGALLQQRDLNSITRLIINGNINDDDIFALRSLPELTYLDILNTSVKILPKRAFFESKLDSVILPKNLQLIGDETFTNCGSLRSVVMFDNVKSINANAFYGCTSLISIELPDGLNSIGEYAFYGCTSLISIELPDGLNSIGESAFCGCSTLISIEFPDDLVSIGDYAFERCSILLLVEFGEGLKSIGNYAFNECSLLVFIELPDRLESIGDHAFSNCKSLTSITVSVNNPTFKDINGVVYSKDGRTIVLYPQGREASSYVIDNAVEFIDSDAFAGCTSLTSIELPDRLNSIGEYSFYGCSALTSIEFPNDLVSIGDCAFESCSSLLSIEFPDGLVSIGDYAFANCDSLTSITVSVNNPIFKDINGVVYSKDGRTIILYPQGREASSYVIDNAVEFINFAAFRGCKSLESISFPDELNSIGEYAFHGCSALASIDLPGRLKRIDRGAFLGCSSLTSVLIPEGLQWIDKVTFADCVNLESVVIASTVTVIYEYAFLNCSQLTLVSCLAVTPPTLYSDCFYNINPSCLLKVPAQSIYQYKEGAQWGSVFKTIEAI